MITITGYVRYDPHRNGRRGGRHGLANIPVVLQDINTKKRLGVYTGNSGQYTFLDVPAGQYRVVEAYGEPAVKTPGRFNSEAEIGEIPAAEMPPLGVVPNPPPEATHLDAVTPNTLEVSVETKNIYLPDILNGPVTEIAVEEIAVDAADGDTPPEDTVEEDLSVEEAVAEDAVLPADVSAAAPAPTGCGSDRDACHEIRAFEKTVVRPYDISRPVTVRPSASPGRPGVVCGENTTISCGITSCDNPNNTFEFTATQKICVELPVSFGAKVCYGKMCTDGMCKCNTVPQ